MLVFRDAEPRSTLVVTSHGGLASKETVLPICWEARRRGADCVAVDALGHGASARLPRVEDEVPVMRAALRVDRAVGAYREVRYVGHSMGGWLGAGGSYPCDRAISIGNETECAEGRVVRGSIHRALGLGDGFYLPVSHVAEPWTPSVVRAALDRTLPGTSASARLTLQIALAWAGVYAALAFGVLVAKRVRETSLPPAARGLLAGAVVWTALAIGAYRTTWFLFPTQLGDLAPILVTTLLGVGAAEGLHRLGVQRGVVAIAAFTSEAVAVTTVGVVQLPLIGNLLALVPILNVPLVALAALGERLSRGGRGRAVDVRESAAFACLLLGTAIALLSPAT